MPDRSQTRDVCADTGYVERERRAFVALNPECGVKLVGVWSKHLHIEVINGRPGIFVHLDFTRSKGEPEKLILKNSSRLVPDLFAALAANLLAGLLAYTHQDKKPLLRLPTDLAQLPAVI